MDGLLAWKEPLFMGKDLETLFDYLKALNDNLHAVNQRIENLIAQYHNHEVTLKIVEHNVDGLNEKMDNLSVDLKEKITELNNDTKTKITTIEKRCEDHKNDLKTANNFIMLHDAKEKTILGLRTDFIAWLGVICALVALAANLDKIIK